MKVIDGKGIVLGKLASKVAQEALKGHEVHVINCEEAVITGNRTKVHEEFMKKRKRMGSTKQGPKHIRKSEWIVKRSIRGMLPDYKKGRGREAWKRIRCHKGIPNKLKEEKPTKINQKNKIKKVKLKELEY